MRLPTAAEKADMVQNFHADLETFCHSGYCSEAKKDVLKPIICAVCDSIPKHENWAEWIAIQEFEQRCQKLPLLAKTSLQHYPKSLVDSYSVPDCPALQPYVLSPASTLRGQSKFDEAPKEIAVCKSCWSCMKAETGKRCKGKPLLC